MNEFKYVTVTKNLRDEIAMDLERGESVVVLGAPGSGKFLLRRLVREKLMEDPASTILEINFQHEPPFFFEAEVHKLVSDVAREAGATPRLRENSLLGSLDGFEQCTYLLLDSVDALANHLLRQLLEELRSRATRQGDRGRVVVLILGEYDLRDFVYGPASKVTDFVSRSFVLQGCDFESFDEFLKSDFLYRRIQLPARSFREWLWTTTGGNADLVMSLVNAAVWHYQRKGVDPLEVRIREDIIEDLLENGVKFGLSDAHLLRHALNLVPLEPDVWDSLYKLVHDEQPALRTPTMRPAALTLSGIAKRREGFLEFSSEVSKKVARRVFNDRFFGDLYGQYGDWDKAFEFFKRLNADQRLRPLHGVDRSPATNTIRAAKLSMDKRILESADAVRQFFAKISRYVLGFPEVFFWQCGERKQPFLTEESVCSADGTMAAKAILDSAPNDAAGESSLDIPQPWKGAGFAWRLESGDSEKDIVAFVGDFQGRKLVNPERESLLKDLFDTFVRAHRQALDRDERLRTSSFRKAQNAISSEVLRKLGVEIFDVEQALKTSAHGLRDLGYRRIGFTLVDPNGKVVRRVVDSDNYSGIRPKEWFLTQPDSGVHPWVVIHKVPLPVLNAPFHPLTDKEAVEELQIKDFMVVPILGESENVAGTIYVEREDKCVPSKAEAADFLAFGRLLYSLMAHAQRVALFQKSLDVTLQPLVIVDAREHLRYANKRAAELLNVNNGWRSESVSPESRREDTERLSPLEKDIEKALLGRRVSHHEFRFPLNLEFKGSLMAASIKNSLNQTIGAFVHVEDLTYVDRVLNALDCVAQAHDRQTALSALTEASRLLGHPFTQLYLISEADPGLLESYGKVDGVRDSIRFRNPDREHAWLCIREREAVAFHYGDEDIITPNDLKVRAAKRKRPEPFLQDDESYWVEAPLVAGQSGSANPREMGSVVLKCDRNLLPEHLHFLNVFFKLVANLLELHVYNEQAARRMEEEKERTARIALGLVSHNLATRVAGFSPFIALYERMESKLPELALWNKNLRSGHEDVVSIFNRAKHVFSNRPLEHRRVDLFSLVDSVLAGGPGRIVGDRPLLADVDDARLKEALSEIIRNSLDFASDKDAIEVHLSFVSNGSANAQIIVSDKGPGVPINMKSRIFEDFFTYRPGRDSGYGLGLGLVRRVIEQHGGNVYENGIPGEGARFVLSFPQTRGGLTG